MPLTVDTLTFRQSNTTAQQEDMVIRCDNTLKLLLEMLKRFTHYGPRLASAVLWLVAAASIAGAVINGILSGPCRLGTRPRKRTKFLRQRGVRVWIRVDVAREAGGASLSRDGGHIILASAGFAGDDGHDDWDGVRE
jgi:hypothetical protein